MSESANNTSDQLTSKVQLRGQLPRLCRVRIIQLKASSLHCKPHACVRLLLPAGAGVFGVEMFLLEGGELLLNEVAPRPHNSGHYTIEGCATSQFEQHLRAVMGWPLGSPELLVGSWCAPDLAAARHISDCAVGAASILDSTLNSTACSLRSVMLSKHESPWPELYHTGHT